LHPQQSATTDGQTLVQCIVLLSGNSKGWLLCQGKPVAKGDRKADKGRTGRGDFQQNLNKAEQMKSSDSN